jgi:hypothetical protein
MERADDGVGVCHCNTPGTVDIQIQQLWNLAILQAQVKKGSSEGLIYSMELRGGTHSCLEGVDWNVARECTDFA